jgi:AmmeMemoRadiSam system protein B
MMEQMQDVRPSPIAGQWYPGSPDRLAGAVDRMLADAPAVDVPGQIVALVAPHAGYVYSGAVAARAFKLVAGLAVERVVVISPMHHPMPGAALTTGHDAYRTPLGVIPVDRGALDALGGRVALTPVREDPEHALEIELPFLQQTLDGPFALVPLMLRDQTWPAVRRLGEALADVLTGSPRTLIVASSDLSHFYAEGQAHRLDRAMLDRVAAFDPEGVIRVEERGAGFACGRGAIAAALIAARGLGADAAQIVGYATSADAGAGSSRVVGYGAAVIYRQSGADG